MPANTKTITLTLAAAASTGISTSASGTSGTSLLINGSLATAGVATLDSGGASRQVIITSAGNDSSINFLLTGTDRYGRTQSEKITGGNNSVAGGVVTSVKMYKTVTSIVPSGNTASTVTAGTNSVGASDAYICDWVANPNQIGAATLVTGTVNYTVQEALDDLAPAWDQTANNPNWQPDPNFTNQTNSIKGQLSGPFTMIRLLVNSGTGSVTLQLIVPFNGGRL